jgi:hypothetical protein
VVASSRAFVPVFIDTLADGPTTRRFGESYGSYPVLRIHDHRGNELAKRLDGNPVAGRIPVSEVLDQLERGLAAFGRR